MDKEMINYTFKPMAYFETDISLDKSINLDPK